jgi:hypothetical protein
MHPVTATRAIKQYSRLEATTHAPGNGYEGDKAVLLPPNLNRRHLQKTAHKEVKRHTRRMVHKCSKGKWPVQSDAATRKGCPKESNLTNHPLITICTIRNKSAINLRIAVPNCIISDYYTHP